MHISDDIAAIESRLAEPRYAHSDQAVLPKEAVHRVLAALRLERLHNAQLREALAAKFRGRK